MGIGIAFAGGGIRGIAHVGVLKALEENNIKIEAVGGTSAGSIVAALYAMGYKPYYIYVLFKKYAQDIINIGNSSIVNGIGNFIKTKKIGIASKLIGESLLIASISFPAPKMPADINDATSVNACAIITIQMFPLSK